MKTKPRIILTTLSILSLAVAARNKKFIRSATLVAIPVMFTLLSGCVSKIKDASIADIPIPAGISKAEALFAVAASLTPPGHAVHEQAVAAVPKELASSLKAYNDGKDSGKVRLVNDSAINVQRNLHYIRPPLTHAIDPALWDYVIEGSTVKHRFKFATDSKRVRNFIDSLDGQIKQNLTLLAGAKGGSSTGAIMTAAAAVTTYAPAPTAPATTAMPPVANALGSPAPSGNGLYFTYNAVTPDSVVGEAIKSAAKSRGWKIVSAASGSMRLEYKGYTIAVSYGGGGILIEHTDKSEGWAKTLQNLIKRKLPA